MGEEVDFDASGEEELDPIEAVRRAVNSTEKAEFDDGHELKQLIKNASGVTLPEAGKFLLKALRAEDPPIRREGSNFVVEDSASEATEKDRKTHSKQTEGGKDQKRAETENTGDEPEEKSEEKAPNDGDVDESKVGDEIDTERNRKDTEKESYGEEEKKDTIGKYSVVPEELGQLEVWTVDDDFDSSPPNYESLTGLEGAVRRAEDSDTGGIGYLNLTESNGKKGIPDSSLVTVRLKGCLDDELRERMPEMPLDGEYVERSVSGEGCQIPVLGYEVPGWWEDTYLTEDEKKGIEIVSSGFVECTGKVIYSAQEKNGQEVADGVTVKRGSRVMDDWLARVREELTDDPVDAESVPETDMPPVDGVKLTNEQVHECLEHIDPDLPYPEWKRIGYALFDNYDEGDEAEVQKARRVFEQWSQKGEKYNGGLDCIMENISPGEDEGTNVGYLIHKACQNGWVWEADSEKNEDERFHSEGETENDGRKEKAERLTPTNRIPERIGFCDALIEEDGCYGYGGENGKFRRVTNFTVGTKACIEHIGSGKKYLKIKVQPQDEDGYEVLVESKAFNSVERFKDEIAMGFTTRFDGDEGVLNDIRAEAIESPDEPTKGTSTAGLYSHSETPEFVTPEGTLTKEGWSENPETTFIECLTDFEHRWNASRSDSCGKENEEDVIEILEVLPEIRGSEKFLTVLGWFYASPMKPLLIEWSGEFPVLSVSGGTESGKEATLCVLQRAFGTDGEPLYVDSDTHSHLENLSASRSVPVWYDGYHPSNIREQHLDRFHDYCRKTTRCMEETAQKPDGSRSSYRMSAPVVVTGGEIKDPYLVRRSMVTEFETRTVEERHESRTNYATLVGESYYGEDGQLHHPDGVDLGSHAVRYYSWITSQDTDELRHIWHDCRKDAESVVQSRGIESLRGTELQGVRITLFGLRMYQMFAEDIGAEPVIDAKARGKSGEDATEEDTPIHTTPENDE